MAKWADYCISAKRFAPRTRHIAFLRVHPDSTDRMGAAETWPREAVIDAIENRHQTFVTITRDTTGSWKLGAPVRVVNIEGVKYLRTDANRVREDNLDELPDF